MTVVVAVILALAGQDEADASVLLLKKLLELDSRQVEAAIAYRKRTEAPPEVAFDRDVFNRMTTPERFRFMAAASAKDAKHLDRSAVEMEVFYATLRSEQRARLDKATEQSVSKSAVAPDPVASPVAAFASGATKLPSSRAPEWLMRPDGEVISRVYPREALRKGIEGRVDMDCETDRQGYVSECLVSAESPKGMGFGNAALETTGYMRMLPALFSGVPVYAKVKIPLNFKLSNDPSP